MCNLPMFLVRYGNDEGEIVGFVDDETALVLLFGESDSFEVSIDELEELLIITN